MAEPVPTGESHLRDADIMDKVRKWNVKFDKGQDPLAFLERVEELATCYEIPLHRIFKALPELLTKNALAWYRNNKADWAGWDDFVRKLQEFFLPPRYHTKLADEIRTRVQKDGEKAKDFVIALQSLMRWMTDMSSEAKLERIYDNLRPEYRFYIRRSDFDDLGGLIKLAEEFEVLKAEEARERERRTRPNRPNVIERNRALAIAPAYSRPECCWRCGQRGHRRPEGHNQPIIFCSRYGRENARSRHCLRPREPPINPVSSGAGKSGQPSTHDTALGNRKTPQSITYTSAAPAVDIRYSVSIRILQHEFSALIDTGAGRSFIGEKVVNIARKSGLVEQKCSLRTTLANGTEVDIGQYFNFEVNLADRVIRHDFYYLPGLTEPIILGIDFLQKCDMHLTLWGKDITQHEPEPVSAPYPLNRHINVPAELPPSTEEFQHDQNYKVATITSHSTNANMSGTRKAILIESTRDPTVRKPNRPIRIATGAGRRTIPASQKVVRAPTTETQSDPTTRNFTRSDTGKKRTRCHNRATTRPREPAQEVTSDGPDEPESKRTRTPARLRVERTPTNLALGQRARPPTQVQRSRQGAQPRHHTQGPIKDQVAAQEEGKHRRRPQSPITQRRTDLPNRIQIHKTISAPHRSRTSYGEPPPLRPFLALPERPPPESHTPEPLTHSPMAPRKMDDVSTLPAHFREAAEALRTRPAKRETSLDTAVGRIRAKRTKSGKWMLRLHHEKHFIVLE